MPKVLRTNSKPFTKVVHECRDANGRKTQGVALSNTVCTKCHTQIVYVWDNTPTKIKRKRKR